MQILDAEGQLGTPLFRRRLSRLAAVTAALAFGPASHGLAGTTNSAAGSGPGQDPVLNLMLEKGMITEDEADKVQAQVDARRTNLAAEYLPDSSKWKISSSIKDVELYGDLRTRYEDRTAYSPSGRIELNRFRYAARVGLRGDALDDFYYGLRVETSSNPRSSWVTMGSSSPDPYGKSAAGISIGQIYMGWKPADWVDLTVGKMPNPFFTSSMVWSSSINPEGLAEHLNYTVGEADFFANFGQFLYQDENPTTASAGLYGSGVSSGDLLGQTANNIVQIAWEGGFNYHITTNLSVKAAATLYKYYGMTPSSANQGVAPYYGDPYVGEGAYAGVAPYANIGNSGYGSSLLPLPGNLSAGYPNNQVGLDHLTVLEIPLEVTYHFQHLDARLFGDFAYNLEGADRARAAELGYSAFLGYVPQLNNGAPTVKGFSPQTQDVKAYQFGLAVASKGALGLVNGSVAKKNAWELRTYWQHIEQYSLDPNLLDLDFMSGAENLEGIYGAAAYGLSDNFIATIRYGYAQRINHLIGTGGTGSDIPQINPINYYQLLQVDLTFKF